MRKRRAGERVDGCCQSAIGFSIWWISPPGCERWLNKERVPSSIPCPDHSRPVLTAPLTVTTWLTVGWWLWESCGGHTVEMPNQSSKMVVYWKHDWEIRCRQGRLSRSSQVASHTLNSKPCIHTLLDKDLFRPTYCKDACVLLLIELRQGCCKCFLPITLESVTTATIYCEEHKLLRGVSILFNLGKTSAVHL